MKPRSGFTLIELLVVVAIIAILIAILIPTLGRVKESSRRTLCATNLKSQGTSLTIYAAGFNDALPAFSNGAGYWMHDEPFEFGETLLNVSASARTAMTDMPSTSIRRWFYCPSNHNSNVAELWNYGPRNGQNYRAMGYTYLNDRRAAGGTGNYPALPARTSPKLMYRSKLLSTPSAAQVELALDEILSPDNVGANSQFDIPPTGNAAPSATSHLKGKMAAGANVLCFDGHVSWRTFPASGTGALAITNATGSYAWIINP